MSLEWRIDWSRPSSDRHELAEHISAALLQDLRVETAHIFGSLASTEPDGFPADAMSDIDIAVAVENDLALYKDLEELLAAAGLRPLAKNLFLGSNGLICSYMFEGYSPFWNVDVVCRASARESRPDLLEQARSFRSFGSWLSALKRSVRADAFLRYFTDLVPATSVKVLHRPHELFSTLLDEWMSRYEDPLRYGIGRDVLQHVYSREL